MSLATILLILLIILAFGDFVRNSGYRSPGFGGVEVLLMGQSVMGRLRPLGF